MAHPALLGPAERWFEMGKHKRSTFKKRPPGRSPKGGKNLHSGKMPKWTMRGGTR
jgi:hypothetical protein